VHELGHGFNLLHCWQKSLATPPVESRPDAASWMNYPERDKHGEDAFYERFGFEFDGPELIHLRHAFRQNVIMGGKPFTGGAARVIGGGWAADLQDSSLRLKLTTPGAVPLHLPMTCGLELSTSSRHGRDVPKTLGPRSGTVDIAILRPDGRETLFEPLLRHCRGAEFSKLSPRSAPVRDFPFIHYGKHGFAFDRVGVYRLQARYTAPDGLIALSNFATIRVLAPVSRDDRRVAELVGGDEKVGTLISLMGSRAPELSEGDDKLQEIIKRYPSHPMAAVARVVRATGLARNFKTVDAAGNVETQEAQVDEAFALVRPIIDVAAAQRIAAAGPDEASQRERFAGALSRLGTMPGVAPPIAAFVNSRRKEIAAVRTGLAPKPRRRRVPPPRRGPIVTRKQQRIATDDDPRETSPCAYDQPLPDTHTTEEGDADAN